jgi:hypothetical protein
MFILCVFVQKNFKNIVYVILIKQITENRGLPYNMVNTKLVQISVLSHMDKKVVKSFTEYGQDQT